LSAGVFVARNSLKLRLFLSVLPGSSPGGPTSYAAFSLGFAVETGVASRPAAQRGLEIAPANPKARREARQRIWLPAATFHRLVRNR
jgi:hypothetical protein